MCHTTQLFLHIPLKILIQEIIVREAGGMDFFHNRIKLFLQFFNIFFLGSRDIHRLTTLL